MFRKKNIEVNSLKVFIHIQVSIFSDCSLSCKHTNSEESFPESEIRLKFFDSDNRKNSYIFDSQFRFVVLVPSLVYTV